MTSAVSPAAGPVLCPSLHVLHVVYITLTVQDIDAKRSALALDYTSAPTEIHFNSVESQHKHL